MIAWIVLVRNLNWFIKRNQQYDNVCMVGILTDFEAEKKLTFQRINFSMTVYFYYSLKQIVSEVYSTRLSPSLGI